jgi:hypothetical protein
VVPKRLRWEDRLEAYLGSLPGDHIRKFANVMHDATCETNIAGGGCTCNPTISVHPVPGDDSGKRHVLLDDDGKPIAPS